ncbi:MAG: hypothetical protein IPM29_08110 [Planctomycetes bacterium]|nr:hypothetical protein [Planctomycetota bacterium]
MHSRLAATLLTSTTILLAPQVQGPEGAKPAAPPPPPKVAVVGASVTAGFRLATWVPADRARQLVEQLEGREVGDRELELRRDSVPLATLFAAAFGTPVAGRGSVMLFADPVGSATGQLRGALADDPDLVIGLDLLFWFGYGAMRAGPVGESADREARFALQQKGFEMLDGLLGERAVHLVVGDYPVMRFVPAMMMTADMFPTPDQCAELSQRLRDWAAERPRVHVFPLAELVAQLHGAGVEETIDGQPLTIGPAEAFQLARLHPTRLGAAVLASRVVRFVADELPGPLHPLHTDLATLLAVASEDGAIAIR